MDLEVVLTQDDPKLGKRGDVVKVSAGFAKNFLIPNNRARAATLSNLKAFEAEKARRVKSEAERLASAKERAARIEQTSVTIQVQAGEGEKLYGAVTAQDIASACAAEKLVIDKKEIHLEEPVKKLGSYQVDIKLHPQVHAKLRFWVVKQK